MKVPLKTIIKLIVGIALLSLGAWLVWLWRMEVWTLIKGLLGIMIMLGAIILLAIAKD